jgi:non-ribosomal peptide synthetase component F
VEQVVAARDTSRNPLFDVMFSYDAAAPTVPFPEEKPGADMPENSTSKFDMTWHFRHTHASHQMDFSIIYSSKLFEDQTIQNFSQYFKRIVSAVLADPGQELLKIQISTQQERNEKLSLLYQDLEID